MAPRASNSLTVQAYEAIKKSIIDNQLQQGDFVLINALAKQLGTSRTPVREAIKILDKEGLLEVRNGIGVFVRYIPNKEIYDLFEMRALLECTAARSALRHISMAEVKQLKAYWQEMQERLDRGEQVTEEEISGGYDEFHSLLVERCENKVLVKMDHDIHLQILRLRNIFVSILDDAQETVGQHLAMIDCIEHRDVERLVKQLELHMEKSVDYIVKTRRFFS